MAIDVLKDATPTLTVEPSSVWASATCKALSPDGDTIATLAATVDAVDTSLTVTSDTSRYKLRIPSGTGVVAGRPYLVTGYYFGPRVVVVSEIQSFPTLEYLTLTAPLPGDPVSGDTLKGLTVSAALTAACTATLGENYRLHFENTADDMLTEWYHVVRQVFEDPVREHDVRFIIAHGYTSTHLLEEVEILDKIAEDASLMIKNRLRELVSWPHATGDPSALEELGRVAVRLILADEYQLVPPGRDAEDYIAAMRQELARRTAGVVHRIGGQDSDGDGDFADEAVAMVSSIELIR